MCYIQWLHLQHEKGLEKIAKLLKMHHSWLNDMMHACEEYIRLVTI